MIQSIFHEFIQTPFDRVGEMVVDAQKHVGDIKHGVSDAIGHVKQGSDRVYDFFVDDYHPLMGTGFRFVALPLLMPTPLGPLAVAQTVVALAYLGSLAYDLYLTEDDIREGLVDAKRKHQEAGTLWY